MNISDSFILDFNDKQRDAFNLFKSNTSFFLSGPAGVGKSYLLQKMKNWSNINGRTMQLTAMTGAASLLIGG